MEYSKDLSIIVPLLNEEESLPELLAWIRSVMNANGYEYEVLACREAIRNGQRECEKMPHAETLTIMKQMDELRAQWGVKYPYDE